MLGGGSGDYLTWIGPLGNTKNPPSGEVRLGQGRENAKRFLRDREIPARRGIIMDRNQEPLAISTSVSTSSALVLEPTTLVRFLPNADYHGDPGTLTVRLIDDSSGAVTAGTTVDVTASGGTTSTGSPTRLAADDAMQ